MNISIVGFYQYPIPPFRGGSLAIVAYELLKQFRKQGYPVSVFSLNDSLLPNYEEKKGIRYFRIINPVYPGNSFFRQSISNLLYSISASIKINSITNIDVVQCFDPLIVPFIKMFKFSKNKPVIVRFGMGFGLSKGWNLFKRPNWAFLKLADQTIVPSQFLKKLIIDNIGLPEEKVSIIPNGVNLKKFNPEIKGDEIRYSYGLGDSPVILFVGRVYLEKGIDVLIASIPFVQQKIHDVKILIVGPTDDKVYMNRVLSLVSKLRLKNVIFTGSIDVKEELPKFYAACDLFCCPSIHGEAFGNVALEAMASGKPVVASSSGGLTEIVKDGETGYIVPILDIEKLSLALIKILEDNDLQKKMGSAGRKRVEKYFSWKFAANEYLQVYKKAVDRF